MVLPFLSFCFYLIMYIFAEKQRYMSITSFKQMHKEIGTKGVAFVILANLLLATVGSTIGYLIANWIIRTLSIATGLSV